MPNPTSSRARHAAGLTGQPPQPRGGGSRSQHAAALTGVPPQLSAHPRVQAAGGTRHPAQDGAVVLGKVLLTSVNQAHTVLQDASNGHGPANRVRAARSLTGVPYLQQTGAALRAGTTPEALKYMDCSEFVSRVMAIDGITQGILPMNTGAIRALLSQKDRFAHSPNIPREGDIALWEGHVGIVTGVGKGNTVKLTHASGKGKLSSENKYAIKPSQYRSSTFYGYYRPIHEEQGGNSRFVPVVRPIVTARPVVQQMPKILPSTKPVTYRSNADGTFPLEEVVIKGTLGQFPTSSLGLPHMSIPKLTIPVPLGPPTTLPTK